MARQAQPLTDTAIRNAIARGYATLWDGGGLYLLSRSGAHHWRLKYRRPDGRDNRLALGQYPAMTLKAAREATQEAHALLRRGTDPAAPRAAQKAEAKRKTESTFKVMAAEWLALKAPGWSKSHNDKMNLVLRSYLVPAIGQADVATIKSADVVRALVKMHAKAPALVVKAAQVARSVIRYAITEGKREDGRLLDLDLRNNLPRRVKGHLPAATTPKDVELVMGTIKALDGRVTRAALLLCAYAAQRPGNVAAMRWEDVDLDRAEWSIPADQMKMRAPHIVPLSAQAVALIESMEGGDATYVFPPQAEQKTPHLHRDALSKALRDAGLRGRATPHGLRASFRTVARERLGISADVLEAQLAHAKRGETQGAYDRAGFVEERHKVMQAWADYLDKPA